MLLESVKNLDEFNEIEGDFKFMLVTSEGCQPCTDMKPMVATLSKKHGFPARQLDGPSNMSFMKELHVMSVPVAVYFVDGEWVKRELGYREEWQLEENILQYIR